MTMINIKHLGPPHLGSSRATGHVVLTVPIPSFTQVKQGPLKTSSEVGSEVPLK